MSGRGPVLEAGRGKVVGEPGVVWVSLWMCPKRVEILQNGSFRTSNFRHRSLKKSLWSTHKDKGHRPRRRPRAGCMDLLLSVRFPFRPGSAGGWRRE